MYGSIIEEEKYGFGINDDLRSSRGISEKIPFI